MKCMTTSLCANSTPIHRSVSPRVPSGWRMILTAMVAVLFALLWMAPAWAAPSDLAGRWNWGAGGGITELNADGSGRDARGNTVQWTVRDAQARSYTLRWSHGYTDAVTLAADGNSLSGQNQTGFQFSATRVGDLPAGKPAPMPQLARAFDATAIAGEWEWSLGGGRVQLQADGNGRDGRNNTVKWSLRDSATRTYVLIWSHGYTDIAVLSANGLELRVTNDRGAAFTARRPEGSVVRDPPAQPIDLNGSWTRGLLHIWQDGAAVVATATWKRQDGRYVAWRGEGQLRGRTVELRIFYSPMTHGPVGEWRGTFQISADGNTIDAEYIYSGGGQRDRQVYTRDR